LFSLLCLADLEGIIQAGDGNAFLSAELCIFNCRFMYFYFTENTLYPEKGRFIVLIVVTLALIEDLERTGYADPFIWEIIEEAKPLNKTKWLMIPVEDQPGFESVIELLHQKMAHIR
jgi:hypothetical protein